ncbi:hypothetical protein ACFQDE_18410 [Deinococcus caeni]|uniref:hypothetical protein n=1 Tax=Deinococcus caeni TaxID=569127 RepID=UPI0036168582
MTELGLDTLIVPLAGGAAGPLNTGRAGQTGRALNVLLEAAAARNVTVLLDFQVAALDTAGLRDLHAALGPEPEGNPASVGTRLGGVILSPARSPSAAQLGAWRQTVRARFPALPVGYRAPGRSADATATRPVDFVAGSADAPVFRERRAPLGRLGDARRGWQLRAFLTRPGPLEAGVLGPDGGREGRGRCSRRTGRSRRWPAGRTRPARPRSRRVAAGVGGGPVDPPGGAAARARTARKADAVGPAAVERVPAVRRAAIATRP